MVVWLYGLCGMECLYFQYIFSCDMHISIHVSRIKENDTRSSVLKTARRGKRHQDFKSDLRHSPLVTIFSFSHNYVLRTYFQTTAPISLILESNKTMDFFCCKRIQPNMLFCFNNLFVTFLRLSFSKDPFIALGSFTNISQM